MIGRILMAVILCGIAAPGEETLLRSQRDPELDYPIRIVRAEPYLRMGDSKLLAQEGYFLVVHQQIGEAEADRYRLPTPGSSWKLTGRVGRLADGTIAAGFGTYLYWSRDEGRTWEGRQMDNLPGTDGPSNLRAFGAHGEYVYVAHQLTSQPLLDVAGREVHNVGISRSKDLGETWDASFQLPLVPPYTFLAGDGNHIIGLGDGTLLAALDTANHHVEHFAKGWLAQVFYRSMDQGKTWGDATLLKDRAAEVGLLSMGGQRVLAACRGMSNPNLGGKTIQLAESADGGRTWENWRQLTWVFGQAHGDLALLPGGGVVAVYENRYPVTKPDIRARVSWDGGWTWEPEVYILATGIGYSGSVAAADGTIVTVTGDGLREGMTPTGRGYTLQAIRWKPWPPAARRDYLLLEERGRPAQE